jgi:hypothetical protein
VAVAGDVVHSALTPAGWVLGELEPGRSLYMERRPGGCEANRQLSVGLGRMRF